MEVTMFDDISPYEEYNRKFFHGKREYRPDINQKIDCPCGQHFEGKLENGIAEREFSKHIKICKIAKKIIDDEILFIIDNGKRSKEFPEKLNIYLIYAGNGLGLDIKELTVF
jgi:hypothetical protein